MNPSAIALQGLQQADLQLETAAARVAGAGAESSSPQDVVDLSAEMTALTSAQTLYEANLATLKAADQVEQNLVNLRA